MLRNSARVVLVAAGVAAALRPAHAGSDFGRRSDSDACFNSKDKTADETITACWKALNSHMLHRNGVAFALNNLAVAYRRKGDSESALNALNAAIKIEGDTWQALVNRAGVYNALDK